MRIRDAIAKVVERQDLTEAEARSALATIMDGQATPAQIAAFLTALRLKGETVGEILGFVRETRRRARRIHPRVDHLVDVCGTGGDAFTTFNISSTAAFVVAGAGGHVAKHGGRTYRHRSGSADVVEAMGINIEAPADVVERCIEQVGIGFLFAPLYHPAVKHAAAPRREIGFRTVLNVVSPLANPADAPNMLLGVYDAQLTEVVAQVMVELGLRRALVVHGDGMDELTTLGPSKISEVRDGAVRTYHVHPEDVGLARGVQEALAGGAPDENARIAAAILQGERGPRRDIVVLNAGAGLVAAGLAADLREGVARAQQAIDAGEAYDRLVRLRIMTRNGA
ncbi:MAG: anthranilate phosphoribosyltransferase [Armatimonadota bacterium]|nr:anthranilate phosphoribosyltransferase [Armatimonadota bacterium]